jgi:uncharacterized protein (TIGR02453 family)
MSTSSLGTAMQRATFFTAETMQFLAGLRRHNNRRWFEANKDRYVAAVRDRCLRFIVMAGPHLQAISPYLTANPHPMRGSLFRIYRDTRFSADKRPYKTHAGMQFRHAAAKNVHAPGIYLHIEPGNCFAAAGLWQPEMPALTRVRQAIAADPAAWRAAVGRLELEGDSLRNSPRGFPADHPLLEDLKRKDFVTSIAFLDEEVCGPAFLRQFIRACRQMSPLMAFLCGALKLKY